MSWKFSPVHFLKNPHFQTIFSTIRPAPGLSNSQKLWIPAEDGVCLESRYDQALHPRGDAVVLLHGLGGSAISGQIRSFASTLLKRGFDTFRLTLRGFEETGPGSPTLFHFGKVQDLSAAADYVRSRGYKRVLMVGISLGAAFMLNWLRQTPKKVDAAVAISPPMDLLDTLHSIDHPRNRFYQRYFLQLLGKVLTKKKSIFPDRFKTIVSGNPAQSIAEYETKNTIPFYGLKDVETYYQENSFYGRWDEITNPMLIVHAEDDPILGSLEKYKTVPQHIKMMVSPSGGHVGFHQDFSSGSLVEQWAANYFETVSLK